MEGRVDGLRVARLGGERKGGKVNVHISLIPRMRY